MKESWRTSNTARIAELAIPGTQVVEVGTRGGDPNAVRRAIEAFVGSDGRTRLLFPSDDDGRGRAIPTNVERLIIPDGSWRHARRMVHRLGLDALPRLSISVPVLALDRRLRRPPHADAMSTIEAIARAIALLEGEHLAEPLDALYARMVERAYTVRRRNAPRIQAT